jgi:hypothetical protein
VRRKLPNSRRRHLRRKADRPEKARSSAAWRSIVPKAHLNYVDTKIPIFHRLLFPAVMQSAVTRAKPLWKSTRPKDPAGLCPVSRPSPQVKDGRLKFDVQTQQKSSTIDALILHQNESEELIKCQVEKYALEARAENVVGLVVIISTKESATQSPFHCLTQVQLLYAAIRSFDQTMLIAYQASRLASNSRSTGRQPGRRRKTAPQIHRRSRKS